MSAEAVARAVSSLVVELVTAVESSSSRAWSVSTSSTRTGAAFVLAAAPERRGLATRKGMESIAQRVARLRKERGITQVELARALGLTQSVISHYERGELRLHGELLAKISQALGASTDELLGLQQPKTTGAIRNRRFVRRLQKIDQLPRRDQDALLRTIDAFLAKTG